MWRPLDRGLLPGFETAAAGRLCNGYLDLAARVSSAAAAINHGGDDSP